MTKTQMQDSILRAENALRIGDYESSEAAAREILQAVPTSVRAHMIMGSVLGRTERHAEAVKHFKTVLKHSPKNSEALNNLGVMYRVLGRPDEARRALQQSMEVGPKRADGLYNLGNIHKSAGELDEAAGAYQEAIEIDPSFVLAYNNLGTIYQKRGEHEKAIELFSNGLQHDLNHPTLRYNLGISYDAVGKTMEARRQFEHALRSKPGWTDALNNLGIVLEKLERYDESIRNFKEVLEIDERNHVARNNIATVLARQGNSEEALKYYAESLKADPNYERAAANIGDLLEKQAPSESDLDVLQGISEYASQNAEFQLQYAKALMGAQRYDDAERAVGRAYAKRSDDPRVLKLNGLLKYRKGDRAGADESFGRLRELDPEHLDHHLDLAEMLMQTGDTQSALTEVEKLLKQKPDNLQAGVLKADVLTRGGRPKDAVKLLKKLKKKNPDNVETLAALSRAHQTLGEREKAIGALDELINIQGNRATPDDLNALNKSLELYEEAARSLADEYSDSWQRNLDKLSRYARSHDLGRSEEPRDDLGVEVTDGQDEDSVSPWELGPVSFQAEPDAEPVPDDESLDQDEVLDGWEPELPPAMRDMIESGSMPFADAPAGAAAEDEIEDEIPFMRDFPPQPQPEQQLEPVPPTPKTEPKTEPRPMPIPDDPPVAEQPAEADVDEAAREQQPADTGAFQQPFSGAPPYTDPYSPGPALPEEPELEESEPEEPDVSGPFLDEDEGESDAEDHAPDELEESEPEEPDVSGPFLDEDEGESDVEEPDVEEPDVEVADVEDDIEPDVSGPFLEIDEDDSELDDLGEPEAFEEPNELSGLEELEELDDDAEVAFAEEPELEGEPEDSALDHIDEPDHPESTPHFGHRGPFQRQARPSMPKKNGESKAKLLEYLIDLARTLPPDKYREFHLGEARARTEALMRRLRGKSGLLKRLKKDRSDTTSVASTQSEGSAPRLTRSSLTATFDYLRGMAEMHPDRELASGMSSGAQRIIDKIRAVREKHNDE